MCVIGKKNKGGGTGVCERHSGTCLIVILQHRHVCRTPFVHNIHELSRAVMSASLSATFINSSDPASPAPVQMQVEC